MKQAVRFPPFLLAIVHLAVLSSAAAWPTVANDQPTTSVDQASTQRELVRRGGFLGAFEVDWAMAPDDDPNVGWSRIVSTDAYGAFIRGRTRVYSEGVYEVGRQCIVEGIAAGSSYLLGADMRTYPPRELEAQPSYPGIRLEWYSDQDCQTPLGGSITLESRRAELAPRVWFSESTGQPVIAPAGAKSAVVSLQLVRKAHFVVFGGADWDNVSLTRLDEPLCESTNTVLCVQGRFAISLDYDSVIGGGVQGSASAVDLSSLGIDQGGIFWFFDPGNPEVIVKVLDACEPFGNYWVFVSAGTNVGFEMTIHDREADLFWNLTNPDQVAFESVQDLQAFPCQ